MSDFLNTLVILLQIAIPVLGVGALAAGVVFILKRATNLKPTGLKLVSILITQLIITALLAAMLVYIHASIQHAEERMAAGFAVIYAGVMWVCGLAVAVLAVLLVARKRQR